MFTVLFFIIVFIFACVYFHACVYVLAVPDSFSDLVSGFGVVPRSFDSQPPSEPPPQLAPLTGEDRRRENFAKGEKNDACTHKLVATCAATRS